MSVVFEDSCVCMFTRWVDIETKTMSNDCIDNYRSRKLELGFCCCDLHQALSSGSSLAVPRCSVELLAFVSIAHVRG